MSSSASTMISNRPSGQPSFYPAQQARQRSVTVASVPTPVQSNRQPPQMASVTRMPMPQTLPAGVLPLPLTAARVQAQPPALQRASAVTLPPPPAPFAPTIQQPIVRMPFTPAQRGPVVLPPPQGVIRLPANAPQRLTTPVAQPNVSAAPLPPPLTTASSSTTQTQNASTSVTLSQAEKISQFQIRLVKYVLRLLDLLPSQLSNANGRVLSQRITNSNGNPQIVSSEMLKACTTYNSARIVSVRDDKCSHKIIIIPSSKSIYLSIDAVNAVMRAEEWLKQIYSIDIQNCNGHICTNELMVEVLACVENLLLQKRSKIFDNDIGKFHVNVAIAIEAILSERNIAKSGLTRLREKIQFVEGLSPGFNILHSDIVKELIGLAISHFENEVITEQYDPKRNPEEWKWNSPKIRACFTDKV